MIGVGQGELLEAQIETDQPRETVRLQRPSWLDGVTFWTVTDLASAVGLSKFHFARCFRESTGLAPHQYQKLLRLQAGRRLLEAGRSASVAAVTAGFADAAHFTRAFRAWIGVSPGRWARAHA